MTYYFLIMTFFFLVCKLYSLLTWVNKTKHNLSNIYGVFLLSSDFKNEKISLDIVNFMCTFHFWDHLFVITRVYIAFYFSGRVVVESWWVKAGKDFGKLTSNVWEQKLNLEELGWYGAGDLAFSPTILTKCTLPLIAFLKSNN